MVVVPRPTVQRLTARLMWRLSHSGAGIKRRRAASATVRIGGFRVPLLAPLVLIAALAGAAPAPPQDAVGCRVADARYALRGEPRMTARFIPVGRRERWISDVAFSFRSPGGKTFWWLFDAGSSRSIQIISTTDVEASGWRPPDPDGGPRPYGSGVYYGLDDALTFAELPPQAGDPASD